MQTSRGPAMVKLLSAAQYIYMYIHIYSVVCAESEEWKEWNSSNSIKY